MTDIQIIKATASEAALILNFITGLAIYEKAEHETLATESDICNSLFGKNATAHSLICTIKDKAVGFAVYFSTIQPGSANQAFSWMTCTSCLNTAAPDPVPPCLNIRQVLQWPKVAAALNGASLTGMSRQFAFINIWAQHRRMNGLPTG